MNTITADDFTIAARSATPMLERMLTNRGEQFDRSWGGIAGTPCVRFWGVRDDFDITTTCDASQNCEGA